jgi:putative flippase GtrA
MTLNSKIKNVVVRFTKFSQVGFFITVLSLLLSFFFLKIVGTPLILTYIFLYTSMIFLSFWLNAKYTFQSSRNLKKLIWYYSSYGFSMILGVFLLFLFRRITPFENWVLAYLVIPFTLTSNYILSSIIFRKKNA